MPTNPRNFNHILVTGGAGFIGSNFIRYLLTTYPNIFVTNYDLLTYAGNPASLTDLAINPRYRFIQGDIRDQVGVTTALNSETDRPTAVDLPAVDLPAVDLPAVDLVVNFAAESHVDRSITGPVTFFETNVLGTITLLEACRLADIPFHQVSTDEVYGSLSPTDPSANEGTPYNPRSPYSASKAAADHAVKAWHHTYGLPVTISNCSNNYGPYCFPEKFIPLAITNLIDYQLVPLYGAGENIRDWLFVTDHCRAIDLIIRTGTYGETYCVGGDNQESNLQILHRLLAILNKPESLITLVTDRLGHDLRYDLNYSKLTSELGWTPTLDLTTGLAATVRWYQENESWWRPLKSADRFKTYYGQHYGQTGVRSGM